MCRYEVKLEQAPSSRHLGLTVWDASIVAAKFFEHVRLLPPLHMKVSGCLRPYVLPSSCWNAPAPLQVQLNHIGFKRQNLTCALSRSNAAPH